MVAHHIIRSNPLETLNDLIIWLKDANNVLQYGEIQLTIVKHQGEITSSGKLITEKVKVKKIREQGDGEKVQ